MSDGFSVRTGATFVSERGAFICIASGHAPVRFEAASAELAAAALAHLRTPQSPAALRALLERDAGAAIDESLIAGLLEALRGAGVVGPAAARIEPERRALAGINLVLGVTGAIAGVDAPRLVLALQASGASVRVVLTRAARRFVSRGALEAITHAAVPTRLWSRDPAAPVPHIELAQWADAVLVAPASATTLSRVASGDCSDVLSALCIATRAPILFAPSMNEQMWRAPATQRSLATLVTDGHAMVEPHYGVEVADKPGDRRARPGGMLAVGAVVRTLAAWLGSRRPELFREAIDWDALYAEPRTLPWLSTGLDEVIARALAQHAPPPGRLLDVGCGVGAQAHAAAALGYQVVGVDGSQRALAMAIAAGDGPLFLKADLLDIGLETRFDVLLDRGTLHTLRAAQLADYAKTLARLAREGALLVVVHDGMAASPSAQTLRLDPGELAERLPAFELMESSPATLRKGEEGAAACTLFRRRALVSS